MHERPRREDPRHEYQRPETDMTLREGLEEYYRVHENVTPPSAYDEGGAHELFRNHDVGHVVFGTTTTMEDEARTDTWLMYGCDVGFWGYMAYLKQPEATAILKEIGWAKLLGGLWPMTRAMFQTRRRARKMAKKWPWAQHDELMEQPLAELRREYGIQVFSA